MTVGKSKTTIRGNKKSLFQQTKSVGNTDTLFVYIEKIALTNLSTIKSKETHAADKMQEFYISFSLLKNNTKSITI